MRLSQQTLSVLQCRMLFSQPGLLTKSPRISLCIYKAGKAIPLQAWTGPEGSRKLRLPDFMTIST